VQATQDADGSYALVYIPDGQPVELDTSRLADGPLVAGWYDPRTGTTQRISGTVERGGLQRFTPPPGGPDWVLTLDVATDPR
jgi:hypothetical protein